MSFSTRLLRVERLSPFTVPDREMGIDIAKVPEAQKHGWSWRALFNSPDNEAFYGLGQHQSEELNMKGKNEDLFQYNTKVSVPFVISNKTTVSSGILILIAVGVIRKIISSSTVPSNSMIRMVRKVS